MPLIWREGVFACEAGGREILLDLRTGRYAMVGSLPSGAVREANARGYATEDEWIAIRPLVTAGLLVDGPDSAGATSLARPSGQLSIPNSASSARDVVLALAAQLLARIGLRLFGFRRIHGLFGLLGVRGGREVGDVDVGRIAAAMRRTDSLLASRDNCLARTVAFRLAALCRGIDVRLVIGVRRDPFAAHSWAERGGVVLNDELDLVAQYNPILSI